MDQEETYFRLYMLRDGTWNQYAPPPHLTPMISMPGGLLGIPAHAVAIWVPDQPGHSPVHEHVRQRRQAGA